MFARACQLICKAACTSDLCAEKEAAHFALVLIRVNEVEELSVAMCMSRLFGTISTVICALLNLPLHIQSLCNLCTSIWQSCSARHSNVRTLESVLIKPLPLTQEQNNIIHLWFPQQKVLSIIYSNLAFMSFSERWNDFKGVMHEVSDHFVIFYEENMFRC